MFLGLTIAIMGLGLILFIISKKTRDETGAWSNTLQWAYIFLIFGISANLTFSLQWSISAAFLLTVIITGIAWIWHKIKLKKSPNELDNNHFSDYVSGFFPILALIFIIRSFIVEPFQIPSSSMRPGLAKGDFILVNKFAYGVRLPISNQVILDTGKIERGDVVVFNYPLEPNNNYIKRIVAIGGDIVEYKDKILYINGKEEIDTANGTYRYFDDSDSAIQHQLNLYQAQFENKQFAVIKESEGSSVSIPNLMYTLDSMEKQGISNGVAENCQYAPDGSAFRCTVPAGQYFAMGDNRDHSADSRYWGFVDDKYIVGKAFLIWFNIGEMNRVGTVIQ